jgi:hypothetical protein
MSRFFAQPSPQPSPGVPGEGEKNALVELRRLNRVKRTASIPTHPIGIELVTFFKQSVEKRQTKIGQIAACWAQLVPETLLNHSALECFNRGTLTVVIDSASHLYEIKQLLLAGLQEQLLIACKNSGLRKINLKPGRWYDGDAQEKRPRF